MKILIQFCLLEMLLLALPAVTQAQFILATNDDNTITITGYTGSDSTIVIPDTINGHAVVSIGLAAFNGYDQLDNITLPNSLTNIDIAAFNSCSGLTNIVIPPGVINIGDYAFFYCTNLTAIIVDPANPNYSSLDGVLFNKDLTRLIQFPFGKDGSYAIPDSVTNLADEAFGVNDDGNIGLFFFTYSCSGLTNLIIPGSLATIPASAFSHCTGLISVTLGNGVSNIGTNAFTLCSNLKNISIPDSVTNIDELAFYYSGLTNVVIPGSVATLGAGAFAVCSGLTSVTLQDGVTSIGDAGFNLCTNLTNITMPDSLTSIGERAFWFCSGLTNVTISSGVTNIGLYAFSACASLININVDRNNPFYSSADGLLCNKDQTVLIQFPGGRGGSYALPGTIVEINDYALGIFDPAGYSFTSYPRSNVTLTNLIVPRSVITVGNNNFYDLDNLTSVYFEGNAPAEAGDLAGANLNTIFYYLPGTTGWGGYSQTAPWWLPQPTILNFEPDFGVRTNSFGFTISWATNVSVIVDASTNLSAPDWQPVQTNSLTDGSAYFSDPQWTNYPERFYRLRSP
ncbi:MAG TPA: leucine-rich repeat domain-containing protein [Verrucomicrobiae bacterium]